MIILMIAIEHHTRIEQEEVEEEQEQKETEELQLQGARPSDSLGTNRILPY